MISTDSSLLEIQLTSLDSGVEVEEEVEVFDRELTP